MYELLRDHLKDLEKRLANTLSELAAIRDDVKDKEARIVLGKKAADKNMQSIIDSHNSEKEDLKKTHEDLKQTHEQQEEEWEKSRMEDKAKHAKEMGEMRKWAKECVQNSYESGYYHSHYI